MTSKLFNKLLLFSLYGIAMWFFGNLYEAIVIGPNMLSDTAVRMGHWQNFFVLTNPVFYYTPVPQIATIIIIILFFKIDKQNIRLKTLLKRAALFQVASLLLSFYIITQINLKLFFGDLGKYADKVSSLALLWNILNVCRVILAACVLAFVFKAYVLTQKNTASS